MTRPNSEAVCDTCSIIRLTKGNSLHLLPKLFTKIYIPQAVQKESIRWADLSVFQCVEVKKVLDIGLGNGERESISLAKENNIILISDDDKAIVRSESLGLVSLRSTDILVLAKQKGLIKSVRHVMDTIIKNGDGMAKSRYNDTLLLAGEL